MKINTYLADDDDDLKDFDSVDSNKVHKYQEKYSEILRNANGKKIAKIKFGIHNRCRTQMEIVDSVMKKHGLSNSPGKISNDQPINKSNQK